MSQNWTEYSFLMPYILFIIFVQEPIYIVTELMKNGSLLEYLREGEGRYIGLKQLVDMAAQVSIAKCTWTQQKFAVRVMS